MLLDHYRKVIAVCALEKADLGEGVAGVRSWLESISYQHL